MDIAMVNVKPQSEITKNFVDGASRAPAKYKQGVQRADWQTNAASESAEANYAAGVQEAVGLKSRQVGVQRVSNADWQNAAANKGAQRIGKGMADSAGKQAANWAPYRSFLEGVSLPERTRNATENIQNRSIPIAQGMQDLKRSGAS